MAIALTISVSIVLLCVVILTFCFHYVKEKMRHERHVLALQKGLPVPPEPLNGGPRSEALIGVALLVPILGALVGLGVTIWAWNQPWQEILKWNVTGIAFIAAGWTSCVIVSGTAVNVAVRSFIVLAQKNPSPPGKPPENHNP
jgi:hypothetical protein